MFPAVAAAAAAEAADAPRRIPQLTPSDQRSVIAFADANSRHSGFENIYEAKSGSIGRHNGMKLGVGARGHELLRRILLWHVYNSTQELKESVGPLHVGLHSKNDSEFRCIPEIKIPGSFLRCSCGGRKASRPPHHHARCVIMTGQQRTDTVRHREKGD